MRTGGVGVMEGPPVETHAAREYLNQEARQLRNLAHHAEKLMPYLGKPNTLDVMVNPDARIWVNSLGTGWQNVGNMETSSAQLLLAGIATMRRIPFDHEHPILETIFPLTGDRIEGMMSPVVDGCVMALRTRQKTIFRLDEMATAGILTDRSDPLNRKRHRDRFLAQIEGCNHVEVLWDASRFRRNVLFVGPTGSGKTTLANSFIATWADFTPDDRVVMIEDTPELQCSVENRVQLLATSRISQAELLVASLRLNPKRIVVGEVREGEAARVLLNAWNTGHSGGVCTIHANDALSGLQKLEQLIGGESEWVRERIASAINLVVFIDVEESVAAGRKVREMLVVRGYSRAKGEYEFDYV